MNSSAVADKGNAMAKVLIYAMNFAPEVSGVGHCTGEFGEEFVAMEHGVTVATNVPD